MILEVDDHNEAELDWKNLIDGKDVDVELGYTLDIKAKQITFTVKQEELDETAKELGNCIGSRAGNQFCTHYIQLQCGRNRAYTYRVGLWGPDDF